MLGKQEERNLLRRSLHRTLRRNLRRNLLRSLLLPRNMDLLMPMNGV